MSQDHVARASTTIDARPEAVWHALTDPAAIKQYMFGTDVASDWREGSPITWSGEWQGNRYVDQGTLLRVQPGDVLQYTHFSPLSGLPDAPENYHTVTIALSADGARTRVDLSQEGNATEEERAHSEQNWAAMLAALKTFVER